MTTHTMERLSQYGVFAADVITDVTEAANRQNQLDFKTLAENYGIADGPQVSHGPDGRPTEYIDLLPNKDYDTTRAVVLSTPMATPVNESIAMRAMRFFAAHGEDERLVVVGNPGPIGRRGGKLTFSESRQVLRGDLAPAARPTVRILGELGITTIDSVGFSCGADLAATVTRVAADEDIAVDRQVLVESASTKDRSFKELLVDFMSCEPPLAGYIKAANCEALNEAIAIADTGLIKYVGGLMRMSNLAIANALKLDAFGDRVRQGMLVQPEVRTTIGWGTLSELSDSTYLESTINDLQKIYGDDRIKKLVIPGVYHAFGDDIDLFAATFEEGLRQKA